MPELLRLLPGETSDAFELRRLAGTLNSRRKALKLSQQALGRLVGVSGASISYWELWQLPHRLGCRPPGHPLLPFNRSAIDRDRSIRLPYTPPADPLSGSHMPRRTPGEIRTQLPRRNTRHARRTVIRGLSATTNRQIAQFERERHLDQGDVALAFLRWQRRATRPRNAEEWRYGYSDAPTGHIRTLLETALANLRPAARRELTAALAPIDARVLARTVNDPFAHRHLPWWQRRIEI